MAMLPPFENELQLQSSLHVTWVKAALCEAMYGDLVHADIGAPALVAEAATCMATPCESVELDHEVAEEDRQSRWVDWVRRLSYVRSRQRSRQKKLAHD